MKPGYLIKRSSLVKLAKDRVPETVITALALHVGRASSSEAPFVSFHEGILTPEDFKMYKGKLLNAFTDTFYLKTLNSLEMGEVEVVLPGLRYRRVPGGWLIEWYTPATDKKPEMVTAGTFLNTSWIVDKA